MIGIAGGERKTSFAVFHYPDAYEQATAELSGWLADGSLKIREEVLHGIYRFPEALAMMFTGANLGKLLVQLT